MASPFGSRLLAWHIANPRPLPWDDGPRDPYHIWVSEVILQQTRIGQGGPYFRRFISSFPNVKALASAPLEDVLLAWEGLGYYTRARNLHKAAQIILREYGGRFPETYAEILALPGIGPYSAAAIASFAFNLPYAVVDGNVKRVIARYVGYAESVDTPEAHRLIGAIAGEYMNDLAPGMFNQAIMNFGALVCKPKNPSCEACPMAPDCGAYQQHRVDRLPVRSAKRPLRLRHLHFLVLRYRHQVLVLERKEKDIWAGLFTPPCVETSSSRKPSIRMIRKAVQPLLGHSGITAINSSGEIRQLLTHQDLSVRFHVYDVDAAPAKSGPGRWIRIPGLEEVAKPKIFTEWLSGAHAHNALDR